MIQFLLYYIYTHKKETKTKTDRKKQQEQQQVEISPVRAVSQHQGERKGGLFSPLRCQTFFQKLNYYYYERENEEGKGKGMEVFQKGGTTTRKKKKKKGMKKTGFEQPGKMR